jgi:hypothetical protein
LGDLVDLRFVRRQAQREADHAEPVPGTEADRCGDVARFEGAGGAGASR